MSKHVVLVNIYFWKIKVWKCCISLSSFFLTVICYIFSLQVLPFNLTPIAVQISRICRWATMVCRWICTRPSTRSYSVTDEYSSADTRGWFVWNTLPRPTKWRLWVRLNTWQVWNCSCVQCSSTLWILLFSYCRRAINFFETCILRF